MILSIPYGHTALTCEAEGARVFESDAGQTVPSAPGLELVKKAMASPIGSRRLSEIARGHRSAVIIISDHTRPVPSRDILPPMIEQLKEGSPDIDITLLVATGLHRGTKPEELKAKLGSLYDEVRVVVHEPKDPEKNTLIGTLPSGAPLVIDKIAAQADLLLSEGFVEPHFFAGFSGGRKAVLPGVSASATVLGNHCGAFIASDRARTGLLEGNPINIDMEAACRMAHLRFIVNVVLNARKETIAAFAGDPVAAHHEACAYLSSIAGITPGRSDIVITGNGGAPLDQNMYQCVKSMTAAEAAGAEGAVLIECAECADGIGGDSFYNALSSCESPRALYEAFSQTPADKTIFDQWQAQILARVLMNHHVIFVTRPELRKAVTDMKMTYAGSLPEALSMARAEKGEGAAIAAIPDGVSVIVRRTL